MVLHDVSLGCAILAAGYGGEAPEEQHDEQKIRKWLGALPGLARTVDRVASDFAFMWLLLGSLWLSFGQRDAT